MSKAKILLVGPAKDNLQALVNKLKSLQSSKAGPFDACFCVGPFLDVEENGAEDKLSNVTSLLEELPLPVYIQNYGNENLRSQLLKQQQTSDSSVNDDGIVRLSKNLWQLHGHSTGDDEDKSIASGSSMANTYKISVPNVSQPLIVASCPPHTRFDSDQCRQLLEKCQATFKAGCDLLLTEEWPQGIEDMIQADEHLSFDTAQLALACRPRYHIAASPRGLYHASPAYHLPGTSHQARFIALPPVIPGKTTKTTKYIHALGLIPLEGNPPIPSPTAPTLPCPFASTAGQETKRPFMPIPPPPPPSRFDMGRKRQRDDDNDKQQTSFEPPDDPTVSSLFLYGLHKDVTGELQSTSSAIVLQTFQKYGVQQVRHPPSSSTTTYCFLEFPSQQEALACLLDCQGQITIKGVPLTLKWATSHKKTRTTPQQQNRHPEQQRHYVTHAEAPNSTTLYFQPPKGKTFDETFANEIRNLMEKNLEDAMNAEGTSEEERITAESEPALRVSVRCKEKYGFLQFASHAAATMALASLTGSTDGGTLSGGGSSDKGDSDSPADSDAKAPSHLVGTVMRWSKGEPITNKRSKEAEYLEALGLERKHFPADSRTDCWFCLASPTCERHLITAVYDTCYTTMPKGPVHPGHVLIVPVTHSSQGVWTIGGQTGKEVLQVKEKLQRHASTAYDMDHFVFERAIQTRGGYHTHVQCVPVPRGNDKTLQATMMAHAKASGFELRPVQSDLGMSSLLNEDNQDEDYFYAELATQQQVYRFLYKASTSGQGGVEAPKVPLQFGREILASVLNQPKLAHWKSCVVDKDKETELATDFGNPLLSLRPRAEISWGKFIFSRRSQRGCTIQCTRGLVGR